MPTYRTQEQIDALTAAAFREQGYVECDCGSTIDERGATTCYPCWSGNRRQSLYGGTTMRLLFKGQGTLPLYPLDDDGEAR